MMAREKDIELIVNNTRHRATASVRVSLADFLREQLHLTGTHTGCEHGVCGACTVFVDGRSVRSCLMLAVQADAAEIVTIEGLRDIDGEWSVMQKAFFEHFALQCGYCTPGFLTSAIELLQENPDPTEKEIREHISGNICRCSGYQAIVEAIQAAAAAGRAAAGELTT
jgi:aerobic-type carbon monoxide dehydrogenase small subunit (CoxS/CutS family)